MRKEVELVELFSLTAVGDKPRGLAGPLRLLPSQQLSYPPGTDLTVGTPNKHILTPAS